MNLFVDVTDNALLFSNSSNAQIDPTKLPLFYGDTVPLQVYLFTRLTSANPSVFQFANIPTAGVTFALFLTNGLLGAGQITYTDQLTWTTGTDNSGTTPAQFFAANIALNTTAIQTLVENAALGQTFPALLQISMQTALTGGPQTIFSQQVNIGVGVPAGQLQVPAPLTPLSLQQANATFWPLQPAAGQVLYLKSAAGHTLALQAQDNSDGSVSFQASQIN